MRLWAFACVAAAAVNSYGLTVDLSEFEIPSMTGAPPIEAVPVRGHSRSDPQPIEDPIAPITCRGGMQVDTDGPADGETIPDPDTHQDETSVTYDDGHDTSISAFRVPYVVKPLGSRPGRKNCDRPLTAVKLWDVVEVEYNGKRTLAIVGDEGPAGKFGEGSLRLHELLGNDRARLNSGVDKGVTYIFHPNSGRRAANERSLLAFLNAWVPPAKALAPQAPAQPAHQHRPRRRDR